MSKQDEYVRKMHSKLDLLNAEIEKLVAQADKAGAEVRDEYHKQIEILRAKREEGRKMLETAQNAGETAWQDLKAGAEMAWEALGEAIESAKSRFK